MGEFCKEQANNAPHGPIPRRARWPDPKGFAPCRRPPRPTGKERDSIAFVVVDVAVVAVAAAVVVVLVFVAVSVVVVTVV